MLQKSFDHSKSFIKKSVKALASGQFNNDNVKALEYLRNLRSKYFLENLNKFVYELKNLKLSISGRLKRFDTIIRKVQRRSSDVSSMGDIIGYRIVTHSYKESEQVTKLLSDLFQVEPRDYTTRTEGYRAIHFIINLGEVENGINNIFEIQVRTHFQHIWSTWSESYGERVKEIYGNSNIAGNLLQLKHWLNSFTLIIKNFENKNPTYKQLKEITLYEPFGYYILHFDTNRNELTSMSEKILNLSDVREIYYKYEELNRDNKNIEIVLLLANTLEHLKETHPRYFSLDAKPDIPAEILPKTIYSFGV